MKRFYQCAASIDFKPCFAQAFNEYQARTGAILVLAADVGKCVAEQLFVAATQATHENYIFYAITKECAFASLEVCIRTVPGTRDAVAA